MFSKDNPHLVYVHVHGISTIGGIDVQMDRGYLLVTTRMLEQCGGEDKHVMFNVQCLVFDVWLAMFNTAIQKTNMWQLSSVAQEGWGFS